MIMQGLSRMWSMTDCILNNRNPELKAPPPPPVSGNSSSFSSFKVMSQSFPSMMERGQVSLL